MLILVRTHHCDKSSVSYQIPFVVEGGWGATSWANLLWATTWSHWHKGLSISWVIICSLIIQHILLLGLAPLPLCALMCPFMLLGLLIAKDVLFSLLFLIKISNQMCLIVLPEFSLLIERKSKVAQALYSPPDCISHRSYGAQTRIRIVSTSEGLCSVSWHCFLQE